MTDNEPEFTAADFDTLAGLDFRTNARCEQATSLFTRCPNTADFTAARHCCTHGTHPMFICRAHMQEITIDAARAFPLNCISCGALMATSEDWIGRFAHL